VSHNTQSRLVVPFLNEFEYWGSSPSENFHSMGTFGLTQVLPTPTLAGSNTPVYKVYMHMENVQLFGRMPLVDTTFIVPQAGNAKPVTGKSNAEAELKANGQFLAFWLLLPLCPLPLGRRFQV
jgi:hypothetical protein